MRMFSFFAKSNAAKHIVDYLKPGEHAIVTGSTGAGMQEVFIREAQEIMRRGESIIYVDGLSNSTTGKLFLAAELAGIPDTVRVVNVGSFLQNSTHRMRKIHSPYEASGDTVAGIANQEIVKSLSPIFSDEYDVDLSHGQNVISVAVGNMANCNSAGEGIRDVFLNAITEELRLRKAGSPRTSIILQHTHWGKKERGLNKFLIDMAEIGVSVIYGEDCDKCLPRHEDRASGDALDFSLMAVHVKMMSCARLFLSCGEALIYDIRGGRCVEVRGHHKCLSDRYRYKGRVHQLKGFMETWPKGFHIKMTPKVWPVYESLQDVTDRLWPLVGATYDEAAHHEIYRRLFRAIVFMLETENVLLLSDVLKTWRLTCTLDGSGDPESVVRLLLLQAQNAGSVVAAEALEAVLAADPAVKAEGLRTFDSKLAAEVERHDVRIIGKG